MRYIIMFVVTIVISLIIIFYPRNYLLKFKDSVTIDYQSIGKDDLWSYDIDNNNLELLNSSNNLWKFIPAKNGKTVLTYYYDKKEDGSYKYKIVYEFTIKGKKIIWVDGTAYGMLDYPNPY